MEIRARYTLIGLFTLAVIALGFYFVYWLEKAGGLTQKAAYAIRFQNTVAGLLPGSAVLFNGVRVGEVTGLLLDPKSPKAIEVQISVDTSTPVRADTYATIDFQGFTSTPAVSLMGGSDNAPPLEAKDGKPPMLVADPNAGQGLTQAARQALNRLDTLIEENSKPLGTMINNLTTFSDALARNSDKVDSILAGLERFTGNVKAAAQIYDLQAPRDFPPEKKALKGLVVVADPTAPISLDTDKLVVNPPEEGAKLFKDAKLSDTLTKLFQGKVIQAFENAGNIDDVVRPVEGVTGDYKLLLDIRTLQINTAPTAQAEVEFSAKILDAEGKVVGGKIFHSRAPIGTLNQSSALDAMNKAFGETLTQLVGWTANAIGVKS